MPRAQASKQPSIAPWRQTAATPTVLLWTAAVLAALVSGLTSDGFTLAAQPRGVAARQPQLADDDAAAPVPGLPADLNGPGGAGTTADPADATSEPADGPLYRPGEPLLQDEQPNWVGPECEDPMGKQSGVGAGFHLLPPSNGRYRAIGGPLMRESWLNRPFSFGLLSGGIFNANPINGHVNGTPGYLFGFRLGWDVDYFWGVESRVAYSTAGVEKPGQIGTLSNMQSLFWDTDLLWYPWGDTQWRPFLLAGLGLVDYRFVADTGFQVHQTTFEIPFGVGMKYRHNSRWTFRFDLLDNLTFASGGGINTMNNISVTATLEAHFGIGPKRSYWPWNPARRY